MKHFFTQVVGESQSRRKQLLPEKDFYCSMFAKAASDLELAQLQLHHVLIGGLNKDSRKQLGVGLHLK